MLDNSRKLILTRHARSRSEQFQLSIEKIIWMFWNSEEQDSPPGSGKYERSGANEGVFYRRSGTFVLTAREVTNQFTGKPAYLLITLFDQRLYLTSDQLRDDDSFTRAL